MEGPQRKYLFTKVPDSILSLAAGNKQVSEEVDICYCGYMPQQAN
jgi:hypothetical protein